MPRFKYKYVLSSLIMIPLTLFAESSLANSVEEDNTSAVSHEMLVKPSYLDFEEASSEESLSQKDQEKGDELEVNPEFFAHLQADAQNLPALPPIQLNNEGQGNQTWVPKFVWLGDIKQSDELKCFAAFLIGSLSNSEQTPGQNLSPGFFITPQASATTTGKAVASSQLNTASLEESNNKLPLKSNLISRSASTPPPPPEPVNSSFFTELDAGAGILLFSDLRGEFKPQPNSFFTNINNFIGTARPYPMRGRLECNVTPIYTADFGFRMSKWMTFSATFQSQQGIHIRTKPTEYSATNGSQITLSHFESDLALYSIGGKILFKWPKMIRFESWNISLYFGGSCSGGWQSWTRVQGYQAYKLTAGQYTNPSISFRDKNFANFVYTADTGLIFKPSNIFAKSSLKLGCKFIGWGAARGLGKFRDQNDISPGSVRISYFKPFRIGTIYSWSPYFGFNWNF